MSEHSMSFAGWLFRATFLLFGVYAIAGVAFDVTASFGFGLSVGWILCALVSPEYKAP